MPLRKKPKPTHPWRIKPATDTTPGPNGQWQTNSRASRRQARIAEIRNNMQRIRESVAKDVENFNKRSFKSEDARMRAARRVESRANKAAEAFKTQRTRLKKQKALERANRPTKQDFGSATDEAHANRKMRAAPRGKGDQKMRQGAFSLDELLAHFQPKEGTNTPAAMRSYRGDFGSIGAFGEGRYYKGRSDPDRNRSNPDFHEWTMVAQGVKYQNNSIAGLMSYNFQKLLNKMKADMMSVSPGSVRNHYRAEVKRKGDTVWLLFSNDHIAFPYLITGTASKREIMTQEGQQRRPYPITPRRGQWDFHSSGDPARDRVLRLKVIAEYRRVVEQAANQDPNERAVMLGGWGAKLKFGGDWVGGPSTGAMIGGTEIPSPSIMNVRLSNPGDEYGKSHYTDRKGVRRRSKRVTKKGEMFAPYVMQNPGQGPNKALQRQWKSWRSKEKLLPKGKKELSQMAKLMAVSIMTGKAVAAAGGTERIHVAAGTKNNPEATVVFRLLAGQSEIATIMGPRKK